MKQVQTLPIESVKQNTGQIEGLPANPRQWTQADIDRIAKSLNETPELFDARPLIVYPHNGEYIIMGGNLRYEGAKKNGEAIVPVHILSEDMDVEKLKEIVIKDNGSFGEWDMDALANEWDDQPLSDWGIDVNWDFVKAEDASSGEYKEVEEDDFDAEKDHIEVRCKRGDVWQLGDHRLMCGDSVNLEDVKKLMGGAEADLVFTDPPYNVAFNGRSGKFDVILNDNLSEGEFAKFIAKFVQVLKEVNPPIYYIWCNWKFYGVLQKMLPFRSCIVWAKNVFGLGKGYRHQHEFCLFCGEIDKEITNESDLWEEKKDVKYVHPTQKPVALSFRAIQNHKAAQNILDFFGGSGSTLIGCEQANKKAFIMELDPHYCDVIIARWEKLTGKEAVLCEE